MTNQLREFVYLNEVSINNHLSSMGRGVPEEVVQQTGEETETSGNAKVGIPSVGLGAGGQRSYLDSDNVETRITVTGPYRFQELRDEIEDAGITIHDGNTTEMISRGDVVEISGKLKPMSLFKFEIAFKAFLDVMDNETQQYLQEIDYQDQQVQEEISEEDIEELKNMLKLIRRFSGDKIPLRLDVGGYPFGIPLDRNHMRSNPERVFFEDREYTVFGRVESLVRGEEQWDPAAVTDIIDTYISQEQTGEEMRTVLKQVSREFNMQMSDEDFIITSPGSIVHPIAVHWLLSISYQIGIASAVPSSPVRNAYRSVCPARPSPRSSGHSRPSRRCPRTSGA